MTTQTSSVSEKYARYLKAVALSMDKNRPCIVCDMRDHYPHDVEDHYDDAREKVLEYVRQRHYQEQQRKNSPWKHQDRVYHEQGFHEVHYSENKQYQQHQYYTTRNKKRVQTILCRGSPPIADVGCAKRFAPKGWQLKWKVQLRFPAHFDEDEGFGENNEDEGYKQRDPRLLCAQYYSNEKNKCPTCGGGMSSFAGTTEQLSRRHQHKGEFLVWIYSPSSSGVFSFEPPPSFVL
jgi:hypothetical protein